MDRTADGGDAPRFVLRNAGAGPATAGLEELLADGPAGLVFGSYT